MRLAAALRRACAAIAGDGSGAVHGPRRADPPRRRQEQHARAAPDVEKHVPRLQVGQVQRPLPELRLLTGRAHPRHPVKQSRPVEQHALVVARVTGALLAAGGATVGTPPPGAARVATTTRPPSSALWESTIPTPASGAYHHQAP